MTNLSNSGSQQELKDAKQSRDQTHPTFASTDPVEPLTGKPTQQAEPALKVHLWLPYAFGALIGFLLCNFLLSTLTDKAEVLDSIMS
jgi:hypothetical protein